MKYNYIPDSYNRKELEKKFKSEDEFISIQILYRHGLEDLIKKFINFQKLDEYIMLKKVIVPKVDDKAYNFYHKYSSLGSDYLFLRNNFHVENLTAEEIESIKNGTELNNVDFFIRTLARVIFEAGDFTFFGPPSNSTEVNSKSVVFEFAYDQTECTDIKQLKDIEQIAAEVFKQVEEYMSRFFNLPVSFLVYKSIPDLYYRENDNVVII